MDKVGKMEGPEKKVEKVEKVEMAVDINFEDHSLYNRNRMHINYTENQHPHHHIVGRQRINIHRHKGLVQKEVRKVVKVVKMVLVVILGQVVELEVTAGKKVVTVVVVRTVDETAVADLMEMVVVKVV